MSSEPIADGAVVIGSEGLIEDVGPARELLGRRPDGAIEHLGEEALIMPGLIDAHCHLEWSCFEGLIAPRPFAEWVSAFLPRRARMRPVDHATASRHGALRALRAGTTAVADSGPTGEGAAALGELGMRGLVHLETFGAPTGREASHQAHELVERVEQLSGTTGDLVGVGISPHAPYSVGPELWRALAEQPSLAALPWSTHLAESPDEERAVLHGRGALPDLLERIGARLGRWPGEAEDSIVARVDRHGALREGLIAAHCVRLHEGDERLLRSRGVSVAHCPRSNRHLHCGRAPIPRLLAAGARVAIGSDSPASGGDYDLRAEARACRETFGALAPSDDALLRMITRDAARALGLQGRAGALEEGMEADITVLDLSAIDGDERDPHTLALDPGARVRRVLVRGRSVLEDGSPTRIDPGPPATAARALNAHLR